MEFETREHPMVQGAVDVLMMVGEEFYTVSSFIAEATNWGVSKRISGTSIPEGIVPYVSRIFVWHPKAIPVVRAEGKTLADLTRFIMDNSLGSIPEVWERSYPELFEEWSPEEALLPSDYVPANILSITYWLEGLELKERQAVIKEFGIEWQGGAIGYSYLGDIQYVCKPDEDELPEEYQHIPNMIPVKINYVEKGAKRNESY